MLEISDGLIKEKISLKDYLQFLLFFPTVSSGPIDRSRRFIADIREQQTKAQYLELAGVGAVSYTHLVEQIIGLDDKQFCQIIILPQGKFKEFLLSNSNEKKEVRCV